MLRVLERFYLTGKSLWKTCPALSFAQWDVATPASSGPYRHEADCRIWYASVKWSEMTVSEKTTRMSQTVCLNITLLFSSCWSFRSLSLSFSDHIQHLIFDSRENIHQADHFPQQTMCAQMKANTGRWKIALCVHGYTCLCIIITCRDYEDWHQLDAIFFSNMNIVTDKSLSSSAQHAAPHGFIADRECVIRCSWASIKVLSEMIGNRRVGVMIWSVHLGCDMWR